MQNYFCGTEEEAKHFLRFKDCNQNLKLNMKLKKSINKNNLFEKKWVLFPL